MQEYKITFFSGFDAGPLIVACLFANVLTMIFSAYGHLELKTNWPRAIFYSSVSTTAITLVGLSSCVFIGPKAQSIVLISLLASSGFGGFLAVLACWASGRIQRR